jgi:hypothetical protein
LSDDRCIRSLRPNRGRARRVADTRVGTGTWWVTTDKSRSRLTCNMLVNGIMTGQFPG